VSSKRQQILSAIKTRFAAITTANGYQTNIGPSQTEHHPTTKDVAELPSHDIRDETEETDGSKRNAGTYERRLKVTVIAELVETDSTAAKARKALEDMIRAVGVDSKWGGLARYTIPLDDEVTVDEDGQLIGAARLTFEVIYDRKPWEP
jgi:hypothetical protein